MGPDADSPLAAGDVAQKAQPTTTGVNVDTQRPAGTHGTNAGNLLNLKGEPSKTKPAAVAAQKHEGAGEDEGAGEVVETADCLVVRQLITESDNVVTPDTEVAPTLVIVEHVTGRVRPSVALFASA